MRILITSGGTREPIDDVRILTNVSSGRLGAILADVFLDPANDLERHRVDYLHSRGAALPSAWLSRRLACHEASCVDAVLARMEELVPQVDAVIHAMAISDFGFAAAGPRKLASDAPEAFIEDLRARIRVNPKLIARVRDWHPDAILVGFKYEVGRPPEDLRALALASLRRNRADRVLCNDKAEIQRAGQHVGYLVRPDGSHREARGKLAIARLIRTEVEAIHREGFRRRATGGGREAALEAGLHG